MTIAPYGSWVSPVTIDSMTQASLSLSAPLLDGPDLYWLEARAAEGGRVSLWRRRAGEITELTPAPTNVRTRVHEYGGGEYGVRDGVVVYSSFPDGRLWVLADDGPARPLTPDPTAPDAQWRYGDLRAHPGRGLVLAVREDHTGGGEPVNTIVALDLGGDNADGGRVLCSGAAFYAGPELATDGRLAWVEWDHPNMPWDATRLMVGELDAGSRAVSGRTQVAGSDRESALEPRWAEAGVMVLVSDRTGWWNLNRWDGSQVQSLWERAAEFAAPPWTLGERSYAVLDDGRLLCTAQTGGVVELGILSVPAGGAPGELVAIGEPGDGYSELTAANRTAAMIRTHLDRPHDLALLDLESGSWEVVRTASGADLETAQVSRPQAVTWTGPAGDVHGWFYPPTNTGWSAPAGELPPLMTLTHGGPSACAMASLRPSVQFWTSRGFGVLDVNYSGSTGFGRGYRDRLRGTWGLLDVADCAAGARALGEQGLADPARCAIMGGSAGGYTTLQALTTTDAFGAGISLFGIGDLELLARDTHKFESRYLDGLVGPYPQDRQTYLDRSPIHHVDDLAAPILLLQGADDLVVPPNQAETMAAAARAKGLPVALIVYPGEGHGFRRSETIRSSLEAQLYFLGRVFGFTPADPLPPIPIANL